MYVDYKRILEVTNGGLDIILTYYPDAHKAVSQKGAKFKIRDNEKTASCTLKKLTDGNYVVTDFGGDQKPKNAIHVCMEEDNLTFAEACSELAVRFRVTPDIISSDVNKPDISSRPATAEEKEGEWLFDVREDYTVLDVLTVLADKTIPYLPGPDKKIDFDKVYKVFRKYNFYSLKSYSVVKNRKVTTIAATDQYPIFCWDEGEFQKIYQPLSPDKGRRFMYVGGRPKDFLHGLKQSIADFNANVNLETEEFDEETGEVKQGDPDKLSEIIYCSGGSDAMNLAMIGYSVVWPNSETAKLTDKQFKKLASIAEKVMNMPDIDITGKREAHRLAMEHLELHTIYLPDSLMEKRDRRGNPCKDVRDFLRFHNYYDFKLLTGTALPYQFWSVDYKPTGKKGKFKAIYNVKNTRLYNFLKGNGFARIELENEKEGYIYIRIEDNIIRQIKSNEIKAFVHDFLQEKMLDEDLRDTFFKSTQLGEASMSNLPIIEIDFTDYDKHTQYFFFRNRTVKVTASKIEAFKPGQVDRYVWEDEVIKHKYEEQSPHFKIWADKNGELDIDVLKRDNIFFNYLIQTSRMFWRRELEDSLGHLTPDERVAYQEKHKFDIAGPNLSLEEITEQKQHLINKIYALGYILHRYRDPSRPWAIFAMDNRVSDDGESHGGSGKSICWKAPRLFMKSVTLDGRRPKLTEDQFIYENVTRHTDYILVDDGNQYLNFQFFFAPLTGELTVNPKNNQRFIIPFNDVPKFAITSNFTLRNLDSSTLRRLLYTVFSDYYHENSEGHYNESRSPKDDFGKNILNEDFTEDEWNDFHNFMIQCCMFYMNHDKIEPPMANVEKRNMISEMGNAFRDWADVYFSEETGNLNDFVDRNGAFEDFKKNTRSNWTSQKFGKAVRAWCKYYDYELNPKDYQNSQGRIIRKITLPDGRETSAEYFFVNTKNIAEPIKSEDDEPAPF